MELQAQVKLQLQNACKKKFAYLTIFDIRWMTFCSLPPIRFFSDLGIQNRLNSLIHAFHSSIAEFSKSFPVIIDHVLQKMVWSEDLQKTLAGISTFYVGIHCNLKTLKEREISRGDRTLGLAKKQYLIVHQNLKYDLEIHSDVNSPIECPQKIISNILQ